MNQSIQFDHQLIESMKHWRQHLHAHPELGFEEHQTAEFVIRHLKDWGYDVQTGVGGTGVVASLSKGKGSLSIALRADMDALPIEEINNFDYCSTHPGVMHACGHDGHTSMLLGAAQYLREHGHFDGTVTFIFQPAEEHGKGAMAMINDGIFEHNEIDEVYGMHNIPGMPIGSFATRTGTMCASESLFEIKIKAQGGHAALPHTGVDAILVGADIVNCLQSVVSRKIDPSQSAVVSVTEFITDGSRNVLPGNATLKGDVRALNPNIRDLIEEKMRQITQGIALAHQIEVSFDFDSQFVEVINSNDPTAHAINAANRIAENVDGNIPAKTFSEDFAHFSNHRPGCFMLMGNGTQGAHAQPLHAADYNFNDDALAVGVSYWVSLVEQRLKCE